MSCLQPSWDWLCLSCATSRALQGCLGGSNAGAGLEDRAGDWYCSCQRAGCPAASCCAGGIPEQPPSTQLGLMDSSVPNRHFSAVLSSVRAAGTKGKPSADLQQLLELRYVKAGLALLSVNCSHWLRWAGSEVLSRCLKPWGKRGLRLLGVCRDTTSLGGVLRFHVLHHWLVFDQIKWISKSRFLGETLQTGEREESSSRASRELKGAGTQQEPRYKNVPLRGGRLPAPGSTHAPQQREALWGGFAYEPWGQREPRPWAISLLRSAFERVGLFPFSDSTGLQRVNCSHGTDSGMGGGTSQTLGRSRGGGAFPFVGGFLTGLGYA